MTNENSATPLTLARCNRSGSDTRKRSQVIGVRVTPAEHAEIAAFAAAHGMSAGELLRVCFTAVQAEEIRHA